MCVQLQVNSVQVKVIWATSPYYYFCLFACFFSLKIFTNTSAVLRDCEMSTLTYIKSYFCGLIFVIIIIFYCAHTDESSHKRKWHRQKANLAKEWERQMRTVRHAELFGFWSNLIIFGYLHCAQRRQVKSLLLHQPKLYNNFTLEKQDMHLTSTILYIGVTFSISIGFTGQQALVSYLFAFRLLEKLISILTFFLKSEY